jgi:hypothetical protein
MAAGADAAPPEMADGLEPMQRAGLVVRNARGLRLRNVEVSGQLGPALAIADSADVEIQAGATGTPPGDAARGDPCA